MIDWGTAERVAGLLAGGTLPVVGRDGRDRPLPGDIAEQAREAALRISDYTGLAVGATLPPPEGVDRQAWIAANLESMRPLVNPLAEKVGEGLGPLSGPLRSVTGVLLGAQVGALVGLLSQRVLGQYDMVLLDATAPTRLLLVTPNLADAAHAMDVDHDQLVRWVTIHEVTHAVQFAGVEWLRGHLAGLVTLLLDSLDVSVSPNAWRLPDREGLRALADAARRGDLLRVVVGPERHALVERLQATMSMVEGHAEHVMDAVGADMLPSLPQLRAAMTHRRTERPAMWRLLERLLGFDLKMRQYEVGRRFCDHVVRVGGRDALRRAWAAPTALPTAAELEDPDAWLKRTNVPAVTKSAS